MIPTSALPPLSCRTTGEFPSAKTAPPIPALLATGPTSTAGTCVGADTGATSATRTDLRAAVGVELRAEISAARNPAMRIPASLRACGSAFSTFRAHSDGAPASWSGTLAVEPLPGASGAATGFAGTVPAARIRAADISNGVAGAKDSVRGVGVNTARPSADFHAQYGQVSRQDCFGRVVANDVSRHEHQQKQRQSMKDSRSPQLVAERRRYCGSSNRTSVALPAPRSRRTP
jgi:hypothetical protein